MSTSYGRGGRQARGQGGRGRQGRRQHYSGAQPAKHKGMCAALGNHVFNYGHKAAADQMQTTWEKIVHHIGTIYGQDISNELLNKKKVILPEPQYTQDITSKHKRKVERHATQTARVMESKKPFSKKNKIC